MSGQKTVLIVEDNKNLNEINCRALRLEGYKVLSALTLEEAENHLASAAPDVIVLDIMLPDGNGVEFCREIREKTAAPILFLTAVKGYKETLEGLAAGGDDYLNKPYDISILIAKVRAFLRRDDIAKRMNMPNIQAPIFVRGLLTMDAVTTKAYINNKDLLLSPKEFSILFMLVQNEDKPLSQEELYQAVWNQPMNNDNQALKSTASRLRKKLEGSGYTITTKRGEGYCFEKE